MVMAFLWGGVESVVPLLLLYGSTKGVLLLLLLLLLLYTSPGLSSVASLLLDSPSLGRVRMVHTLIISFLVT